MFSTASKERTKPSGKPLNMGTLHEGRPLGNDWPGGDPTTHWPLHTIGSVASWTATIARWMGSTGWAVLNLVWRTVFGHGHVKSTDSLTASASVAKDDS